MTKDEALDLVQKLIASGDTHQDYDRVTKLANDYRVFITGDGIKDKLQQIVQRETGLAFEQRVNLTKSITPAIASSLRQPFNKVARNDRVRKSIQIKAEERQRNTKDMIAMFFGSARKKNRGLDYWMKTRMVDLNFIDPNTWVVIEWDAPEGDATVIKPRPFEVSSQQAVNFFIANDEVKWLFVKQDIKMASYSSENLVNIPQIGKKGKLPDYIKPPIDVQKQVDGSKYTLYDEVYTIVFQQVDKGYQYDPKRVKVEGEQFAIVKDKIYLVKVGEPKLGYAPAFRVGYKRDDYTNARTFVNPWHDALCYFEKSLKTVSELDLTMTMHAFPQKYEYVAACSGESKQKKCNQGYIATGEICKVCKGSGVRKVHTSAQDIVQIPMPPAGDLMIDLDKLSVTKSPPIDLIKWQNEYVLQLESQAHQAVYNSQVFVKKSTNQAGIAKDKTATEVDVNMQSVYDALEPFTEKISELWVDFVTTFGLLSGEPLDGIHVSHDFPADYKLKSSDVLLTERTNATISGAPSFMINTIDDDLATIVYAGDGLGLQKYRVKTRFAPFGGSSPDEIVILLGSQYVAKEPKVLYSNFEQIFKDIEFEHPEFWVMTDLEGQRKIVSDKVQEFIDHLDKQAPVISINTLRATNPANGAAGSNGGNNNTNQDQQSATK